MKMIEQVIYAMQAFNGDIYHLGTCAAFESMVYMNTHGDRGKYFWLGHSNILSINCKQLR